MIISANSWIFLLLLSILNQAFAIVNIFDFWPNGSKNNVRRLIGSNCILIERGGIPPYYDCVGCIIEEATGCIEDLRHNKSGNVYPACKIAALRSSYDSSSCCPKFGAQIDSGGKQVKPFRLDLAFSGSSFPAAFKCLESAGCRDSLIYQQLEVECSRACGSISDPRPSVKKPICHAEFNSAVRNSPGLNWVLFCVLIAVIMSAV